MGSSSSVSRFVNAMMSIVIGLTFLFGFGNVLALALRIGVLAYVAPLVAPALDLTVLDLLVGPGTWPGDVRRFGSGAAAGPSPLFTASIETLALNVAGPLGARSVGQGQLRHGWTVAAHRLGRGRSRNASKLACRRQRAGTTRRS